MAMENQDTEAKLASLKEGIEKLRNENHNLNAWSRKNLPENLAAKRVRILRNAAWNRDHKKLFNLTA